MGENRVDADAVDADAVGDRIVVPGPKLGQLGPSTTCEIEHLEKEDERAIFLERVAERELLAARRGQLEVGRLVPNLQHPRILLLLQHVPARARRTRDDITVIERTAQRLAHGHSPRTCERGMCAPQRDDVRGRLT